MPGNDMEKLLFEQDDDSSSGGSDAGGNVGNRAVGMQPQGVVTGSSVNVPPVITAQQQAPPHSVVPVQAPMPQSLPTPTSVQQPTRPSDKTAILKSMYSPAPKGKQQQQVPVHNQIPQVQAPPSHHQHHATQTQKHSHGLNSANMAPPSKPGNVPYAPTHHQSHPGSHPAHHRAGPTSQQQHSQPMRQTSSGMNQSSHHASVQPVYNTGSSRGGVMQPPNTTGLSPANNGSGVAAPFDPAASGVMMDRTKSSRQGHQQSIPNPMGPPHHTSSSGGRSTSNRAPSGYHPGMMPTNMQPNASMSSSLPAPVASNTSQPQTRPISAADMKKYKEKFLFFTKVLMKVLEQKVPELHIQVKAIIKDCAERNRRQEPGYESVTHSMKIKLKEYVPEVYWKAAEAHLNMIMNKKSGNSQSQPQSNSQAQQSNSQAQQRPTTSQPPTPTQQHQADTGKRNSMSNSSHNPGIQTQQPVAPSISATAPGKGGKKQQPRKSNASVAPVQVPAQIVASTENPVVPQVPIGRPVETSSIQVPIAPIVIRQVIVPPPPVREYSEFMEFVDHAAEFDWTVTGMLMEKEQQSFLSMEQKALLEDTKKATSQNTTSLAIAARSPNLDMFPLHGWSRRNVLPSRSAWAFLRAEEERNWRSSRNKDQVAGGVKELLPQNRGLELQQYEHNWLNEQKAEGDKVLAMLSEALQIYLRGVLEKAVYCARQRHNVDGIRLWHQQMTVAMKSKSSSKDDEAASDHSNLPPLTLRVGCDVSRQIAQASGNAAMTVKRMEEALVNSSASISNFNAETEAACLMQASSMSELALLPKLSLAVDSADYAAKRNFEVYGGKHSNEPPLGRLPKQPKIEIIDFQMGMNFAPRSARRCRASTASSSFHY